MYKNQLLTSYVCTPEGPDHTPRFRAAVTFNSETFEGPSGCTTLRQAEHAAAEVTLARLSLRAPSTSLATQVFAKCSGLQAHTYCPICKAEMGIMCLQKHLTRNCLT